MPCEQCFRWDFQDTLMRIMTAQEVVDKIKVSSKEELSNLVSQLQSKRPNIYSSLNVSKRPLFIWQTGDNYPSALKRQRTQQMSFCLFNIPELVS